MPNRQIKQSKDLKNGPEESKQKRSLNKHTSGELANKQFYEQFLLPQKNLQKQSSELSNKSGNKNKALSAFNVVLDDMDEFSVDKNCK